ncbi:MAG: UvrD-helicase domain-containing protein [Actinomycetia bacterium]|nr:UvrD-helicase domain-containing protein [Actinomycetes bacterium]
MTPPLDAAARERVRTDLDTNLVVEAGAGTGKTTLLVERAVEALGRGAADAESLVLVTFMEKAAAEIRRRLLERLEDAAVGSEGVRRRRLTRVLAHPHRLTVTTLHGLGYRIVSRYPLECGAPPGATVWDAVEGERQGRRAFDAWLRGLSPARRRWIAGLSAYGASWHDATRLIREMAEREVTFVLPELPETPEDLLGAWRTTLAELAQVIDAVRPDPEDAGVKQVAELRHRFEQIAALAPAARGPALFALKVPAPRGTQARWGRARDLLAAQKERLLDLAARHERWRRGWAARLAGELGELAADYARFFAAWREERRALLFRDQIRLALALLRADGPPRRTLSAETALLMVDEFQDNNPEQVEMVQWLAADPTGAVHDLDHPPAGRLTLVGDPKQAIYGFQGADVATAHGWMERLVRVGAADLVPIVVNFRSAPDILATVNRVFGGWMGQERFDAPWRALHPHRAGGDGPRVFKVRVETGGPAARLGRARRREAETVAELCLKVVREGWTVTDGGRTRGARLEDIAVLIPGRTDLTWYLDAFRARRVPVAAAAVERYYAYDEVRGLAAILRAVALPEDAPAVLAALRSPWLRVDELSLAQHRARGGTWYPLDPQPPGPVAARLELLAVWHRTWPDRGAAGILEDVVALRRDALSAEEIRRAARLVDEARRYSRRWGFWAFVDWLWTRVRDGSGAAEADEPAEAAGVRISTLHQAKGLEWPVVVLANLAAGRPPDGPVLLDGARGEVAVRFGAVPTPNWEAVAESLAQQQEAERRRLWYVGMTRARDWLLVVESRPTALTARLDAPELGRAEGRRADSSAGVV